MRFLVDAQLPPRLAVWLRDRGHEAEHVTEALSPRASDRDVVDHARSTAAAIITKDGDFLDLLDDADAPQLVWIKLGNVTNAQLQAAFKTKWVQVEAALQAGQRTVEFPEQS